jgi:hypothetical protein
MMIVHKCRTCDHPNYWGNTVQEARRDQGGSWPNLRCGQGCHRGHDCDWGDSHVIPTYGADGKIQPEVHQPGVGFPGVATCGCQECLDLYGLERAEVLA